MIRYRIKLTIRNTCSAHPQRGSSMGLGTVPTSKSRQSLAGDIACAVYFDELYEEILTAVSIIERKDG